MSAPSYVVVEGTDLATLQTAVEAKLLAGYTLTGNAVVGGTGFMQSLSKNAGGPAGPFVADYTITAVVNAAAGLGSFSVAGDQASNFAANYKFAVTGSTGNDSTYTVRNTGATFSAGTTVIPVNEAVPDGTVDGTVLGYTP